MPKKNAGRHEATAAAAATAPAAPSREIAPDPDRVPWIAAFCVLSLFLLALMWYPVSKIGAHYTETNFDGFNLHYQEALARGEKLYGTPPQYTWENYPPLSFHLIAVLGSIINDLNTAGRWVCLFAYLAIGVFMALIVEHFTSSRRVAAWAALAWWVWLPAFDVSHVPVNDPHLLGLALGMAGLYCFVRNPESTRWLCASAIFFALSLFTKHSLVDFPAAAAIQLSLTSKKRLAIWLGAATLSVLILFLLTLAIDGPYFLQHMTPPRAYYPWGIAENTSTYGRFVAVGFAVALIWALRNLSAAPGNIVIWAFAIALPVAMVYCGGAGSNINHYYGAMISTAMLAALALPELVRLVEHARFPRTALGILLVVPFFLTTILVLPARLYSDLHAYQGRARSEAEFNFVAEIIRQQPGPAICENTPLCSAAGKPRVYDPFHADQLIRVGQIQAEQIAQLIQSRHFKAIELDWHSSEPLDPRPRLHFAGPAMRALFATYQLKARTDNFVVFVPR
jgi:hypothetical protein